MKKIFIFLMALMMSFSVANAQLATENSKFFDNTYVSVGIGATTPLAFDEFFPVNTTATVSVGKWFSPVWGAEVEGTLWFGSRDADGLHFDNEIAHNFIRGQYIGANGLVNFNNLFAGYKGTPHLFEVNGVLGIGWIHTYNPSDIAQDFNGIGMKTGLDLTFNLGKKKAHSLSIRPAIYWNLNAPNGLAANDGKAARWVTMNHRHAQLYLGVAYTYHFKTSNGTHHFKVYDVGAMTNEIARLNEELAKEPNTLVVEKEVVKEVVKEVERPTGFGVKETVFFAFDSTELDDNAKATLDALGKDGTYEILGYASNEGSIEYNKKLSQRRADAVKAYLEARGAKVEKAEGLGVVFGPTTGRVAIITLK